MKIPDLSAFCARVAASASGKCIRFPGGAKLCIPNLGAGSPMEQLRAMLMLIATALIPLAPFFSVLKVLQAVLDCIKAVPELITDPTKIIKAIVKLVEAFGGLVALFPQVSVPILVKDILVMVSFFLRTIATELEAFVGAAEDLAESADLAAELNLAALTAEVSCAQDALDIELGNMNDALGPLGELLGIVNTLLGLAGLEALSVDLSSGESPSEAIAAMLSIADAIDTVTSAIPV